MEKKFVWIAALFAALTLLVTGCPGGGDTRGETTTVDLTDVFSATEKNQDKATVTITADGATFSISNSGEMWGELVTPEDARWDATNYTGIKFEYKSTGQATILIQDTDSIFIFGYNDSDGWGAINSATDWTSLTLPFSILKRQTWFGTDGHTLDKSAIVKLCFQIKDDSANNKKFELRNLELIADPNYKPAPYPVQDHTISILFGEDTKSATVKGTGYQTVSDDKLTIAWNSGGNEGKGEYRAKVEFAAAAQTDLTDYSKFGMAWTSGSAAEGSFNISLFFTGNRMLSGTLASGSEDATLDFDDVPEWAEGWGDAEVGTITGFEIFSDDSSSIGTGNLVITKIWFEE